MSDLPARYTDDDAREILRRAVALEAQPADLDDQALREMAAQSGISEHALARAREQWLAERVTTEEQAERAAFDKSRRAAFMGHLFSFVVMNFFFMILSLMQGATWFIWPLLGWGIGLASHGFNLLQKSGPAYENEFDQWRLGRSKAPRQLPH